jgi:hypothetical protein
MEIKKGNGRTKFGKGINILLTGEEVGLAISAYLKANKVHISGARTIMVNGDLCNKGRIYVDPSASVIHEGKKYSGVTGEIERLEKENRESKTSSSDVRINLNQKIKVKLKDEAFPIIEKQLSFLPEEVKNNVIQEIRDEKDEDGYNVFQIHTFMNLFGPYSYMGPPPPYDLNVILIFENK